MTQPVDRVQGADWRTDQPCETFDAHWVAPDLCVRCGWRKALHGQNDASGCPTNDDRETDRPVAPPGFPVVGRSGATFLFDTDAEAQQFCKHSAQIFADHERERAAALGVGFPANRQLKQGQVPRTFDDWPGAPLPGRTGETLTVECSAAHEPDPELRDGDTFTIEDDYEPRTFWQWLTRQPRELRQYIVRGRV